LQLASAIRGWRVLTTGAAWLAGFGIILLMLPTVIEVTYRKLLGPSLPGMVEISEVGLVLVVYLSMAAALASGSHVSTPILTDRLPARMAHPVRLTGSLMSCLILGAMAWGSGLIALESVAVGEYRFGLVAMPIWPAKVMVSIGLALLFVESVIKAYELSLGRNSWSSDDV
jgi:TRAP-type C4-dicarboxylate transport system permease small subunit